MVHISQHINYGGGALFKSTVPCIKALILQGAKSVHEGVRGFQSLSVWARVQPSVKKSTFSVNSLLLTLFPVFYVGQETWLVERGLIN